MTIDQDVERVQFAYPQIYFACHTRHERRRSTPHRLSMRDSQILVHLDRRQPVRLTALARHLGLAASTLSEAITELAALGYAEKRISGRTVGVTLTEKGSAAVRETSVLESPRIAAVLRRLAPAERRRAIDGLSILAAACRRRP